MTQFIKIKSTNATIRQEEFFELHRCVSFPVPLTNEILQEYGAEIVENTSRPSVDVISRAQGKMVLHEMGMLQDVIDTIESMVEPDKTLAQIAFNDTAEWRKDSPFLQGMKTTLNIADDMLDEMFVRASEINP